MPISSENARLQIIVSKRLKSIIEWYSKQFGISESSLCAVMISEKLCELILQEEAENETQKKDSLSKTES